MLTKIAYSLRFCVAVVLFICALVSAGVAAGLAWCVHKLLPEVFEDF